jgi:plastocyanin
LSESARGLDEHAHATAVVVSPWGIGYGIVMGSHDDELGSGASKDPDHVASPDTPILEILKPHLVEADISEARRYEGSGEGAPGRPKGVGAERRELGRVVQRAGSIDGSGDKESGKDRAHFDPGLYAVENGTKWPPRSRMLQSRSSEVATLRFTLALALFASPGIAGTVTGRVELVEKGGRKATDVSEAVVYIDGAKAKPKPSRATMVMKGKNFTPHVLVVPVGTTVDFPNQDPLFHNVFSLSGENRFDLDLYKRPKSGSWTFDHPGVARVYCNIHPQMTAVIVVRDSPFYARANADGTFVIEGVPAGKYPLKAWHERGGEASLDIVVPAEGEVGAQLLLDASHFKKSDHKNKFGKDYSTEAPY